MKFVCPAELTRRVRKFHLRHVFALSCRNEVEEKDISPAGSKAALTDLHVMIAAHTD